MVACAICHGAAGKGDGPTRRSSSRPPRPTTLAERQGGTFPFLDELMIVDGPSGVRAHGDSAMPIWGNIFSDSAADAGPTGPRSSHAGASSRSSITSSRSRASQARSSLGDPITT